MRRLGQLLMILGLGVGGAVGLAMLLHFTVPGVSWLVAVGLAKLTLAGSAGLLAGGAFLQRLALRRVQTLAIAAAVSGDAMTAEAQTIACRPTESIATEMKVHVTRIVTATDPKNSALRQNLSLPNVSAAEVVLVSDTTTCTAAANAYSHFGSAASYPIVYPVWVIRVGTNRYVIFNIEQASSRNLADLVVVDDKFNYIATLSA